MSKYLPQQFNQRYQHVLGIDIGKTKLAVGIISRTSEIVALSQQRTEIEKGGKAILSQCQQMAEDILEKTQLSPCAIGIGSSGIVDHHQGLLVRSGTILDWDRLPIRDLFAQRFQVPVAVENDVSAAAFGEQRFGAARDVSVVVYMAISTGIGMAIIKDGQIWHGSHGVAGQIAYLPLFRSERMASDILSGRGIAQRAEHAVGRFQDTADVFRRAQLGERGARDIIDDAVNGAALSLAWIQQVVDPDLFVIGGGVALGEPAFVHRIREQTQAFLQHYMVQLPEGLNMVLAQLGKHSGVIGAAALGFALTEAQASLGDACRE